MGAMGFKILNQVIQPTVCDLNGGVVLKVLDVPIPALQSLGGPALLP